MNSFDFTQFPVLFATSIFCVYGYFLRQTTMMESIDLCTAILGLFMTLPLIAMARRRPANFWLGMFVFSLAWISLADYCMNSGLMKKYPQLFGVFDWPVAAIGSFYYCYVRSLVGLGNSRRQIWHFVPLMAAVVALLWMRQAPHTKTWETVFYIFLIGSQLLAIGYALAVFYRLAQYRKRVRECYSSTKNRDLIWLVWLTVVVVALLLIWVPSVFFGGTWIWFLCLGRLALFYFVGWYGMRQAMVFLPLMRQTELPHFTLPELEWSDVSAQQQAKKNTAVQQGTRIAADFPDLQKVEGASVQEFADTDKYVRSGMTDATQQLIGERLVRRMSFERDYLDCEVKLTDLAERIGTSPQLLSQYLNHVLGLNFFDYINGLRVAEVQRMMVDLSKANQTLLEMAFAAGFNSKSTFNASFKKVTGMAPSSWRNKRNATSEPIG